MRLGFAIVPVWVLSAAVLGAAVPASDDDGDLTGHFECEEYGEAGECDRWVATESSAVMFEELGKTVLVPGGTELTAEEGFSFEVVSAVPGAEVRDGVGLVKRHLEKRGTCRNDAPLNKGRLNRKYKNCRPEMAIKSNDKWQFGAHNCQPAGGKYYLCCLPKKTCPKKRAKFVNARPPRPVPGGSKPGGKAGGKGGAAGGAAGGGKGGGKGGSNGGGNGAGGSAGTPAAGSSSEGCFPRYECTCSAISNWIGYHWGECFG